MLHIWDAVEADFLRDYGIVLMEQIDLLSWRLFCVLLHNLSPNGAVAVRIRAASDKTNRETDEDEDKQAANAFFSSIVSV